MLDRLKESLDKRSSTKERLAELEKARIEVARANEAIQRQIAEPTQNEQNLQARQRLENIIGGLRRGLTRFETLAADAQKELLQANKQLAEAQRRYDTFEKAAQVNPSRYGENLQAARTELYQITSKARDLQARRQSFERNVNNLRANLEEQTALLKAHDAAVAEAERMLVERQERNANEAERIRETLEAAAEASRAMLNPEPASDANGPK